MASMQPSKSNARIPDLPAASAKPEAQHSNEQDTGAKSASNPAKPCQTLPNPAKPCQILPNPASAIAAGHAAQSMKRQDVPKSDQIVPQPSDNEGTAGSANEIDATQLAHVPHATTNSTSLAELQLADNRGEAALQPIDESRQFTGEELFVYCLAVGRSVIEASRIVGIGRNTGYRRWKDPEIRLQVNQMRAQIRSRAIGMLIQAIPDAVRTLNELLGDKAPKVRLDAADRLLKHASTSAHDHSDKVYSDFETSALEQASRWNDSPSSDSDSENEADAEY
jgi:hypothetical protein